MISQWFCDDILDIRFPIVFSILKARFTATQHFTTKHFLKGFSDIKSNKDAKANVQMTHYKTESIEIA